MGSKRVRISQEEYQELTRARDWCQTNDFQGFLEFYRSLLGEMAHRRALPIGASEYRALDEERPSRGYDRH